MAMLSHRFLPADAPKALPTSFWLFLNALVGEAKAVTSMSLRSMRTLHFGCSCAPACLLVSYGR